MKRLEQIIPRGLAGKLIKFVVVMVFILGFAFMVMSGIQVTQLKKAVSSEELKRSELIEGEYSASMEDFTKDSLLQLAIWASDKTDDEFWIIDHDLRTLGLQVQDVYLHPENYARIPVSEPDIKNKGKYVLQLMYSEDTKNIDPGDMEMVERLANLAPMMEEIVRGNEGYTLDCYISTPDKITLAMDDLSDGKFDENGKIKVYDPSSRPWYQGAVSIGDMYFSSAVHSHFYNFDEVVYGYPVYADGKLVAVLEASTRLEVIARKMSERNVGEKGFSVLISTGGQLVCSQRTDGELKMREDLSEDIRESVSPQLKELIDTALTDKEGVVTVEVDGEKYYAAYSRLGTIKWTQITFESVDEAMEPANNLLVKMDESAEDMLGSLTRDFKKHTVFLLIALLVLLQVSILIVSHIAKRRVRPIEQMTDSVSNFVSADFDFEMKDVYRTNDEIEKLAEAFDYMSGKMKEYVAEIVANTAEKERTQAEMEAASQIQLKMLPQIEPDFSGRKGYELYADMKTAVQVGGDLYDFYYLDDDRLVITIGDVSGKGITAALFMALSKQMLKSQMVLHGGNIREAMNAANKRLCEESADAMFVTVWLGVLTISSGVLEFVDAGHLYAAVKSEGSDFEIRRDIHCALMGGLKFIDYKVNTIKLNKGDVVYLYTDGVTEAHNEKDELFGDERFLNALNENKDAKLEEIDKTLRKRIEEFSNGVEQYDDITTIAFRYTGTDS